MFISHKYKAIFVHIQRTGGSSITTLFREHDPNLIEVVPIDPKKQRLIHCYLPDIKAALAPDIFNTYTKFCAVRNPFDRLVSWYCMFQHDYEADSLVPKTANVGRKVMQLIREHAPDFDAFVRLPFGHESGLFRRFYATQMDYILDEDGNVAVDRILRFETLDDDFRQLAADIGFEVDIPHTNRSRRTAGYRECYTPETQAIVWERFKPDFEYFGYDF